MPYQEDEQSREPENPENYRYIPRSEVSEALDAFGYGSTKKFVDALYIHPDGNSGVGVLKVTEEHCKDHFGLLRGVDQGEAIAQTLLLLHKFVTGIPDGQSPLLEHAEVDLKNPALPGSVLNITVNETSSDENSFTGQGAITSGNKITAQGVVSGRVISTELLTRLIERSKRQQVGTRSRFQIKE